MKECPFFYISMKHYTHLYKLNWDIQTF